MSFFRKEPIIVIGMHRSGTALLVRVLEEMGVFMGGRKEKNGESVFFLRLNEWNMRQVGARWDKPDDMVLLLENKEYRDLLVKFLSFFVKGPMFYSYLGMKGIVCNFSSRDRLWGWKDPRNTFTLPLWLDVFPNAKVICVERNGLDVAKSLVVRQKKDIDIVEKRFSLYKYLYSIKLKREPFGGSALLQGIDDAIDLWYKYVCRSRKIRDELGDRYLFIKYEDFLENPRDAVNQLSNFLGIHISDQRIIHMTTLVNKSRANAYKEDEALRDLAEHYKEKLRIHDQ